MRGVLIIQLLLYFVVTAKKLHSQRDEQNIVISRTKAHEFLTLRSSSSKRVRKSTYIHLEEECCNESCNLEEMEERHEDNGFAKPQPYIIHWLREKPNCKHFYCDDATPIETSRRCDFKIDCANGEDEQECTFKTNTNPTASLTGGMKGELFISVDGSDIYTTWLDTKSSAVISKSLGCSSAGRFLKQYRLPSNSYRQSLMTLQCYGNEKDIKDCKYSLDSSYHYNLYGVICLNENEITLKNQGRGIDGSVYGATTYISGMPICYAYPERDTAQVICNTIKDSSYIGAPYRKERRYSYELFLIVKCNDPNKRLSRCVYYQREYYQTRSLCSSGVICLKETFKQPCIHCPLKAMGTVVIATDSNYKWTLKETNVFCRQEHNTNYKVGIKNKYQLVKTNTTKCSISNIRCKGDESDLRKCDFQLLTKCPTKPFYQIHIDCLPNFKELIQIIEMVDTKTNDLQNKYNSVKKAKEKLILEYGQWECTGNPTGEGIKAYCSTFSALRNLENILKPRKDESIIFIRTNHDIKRELSEKLLDERFSSLHTQISALGTRTTEFQLQLSQHLQRMSSFKVNAIKAKITKRLLPWKKQLEMLFESKLDTFKTQTKRLKVYADRVQRQELAEATLDYVLASVSFGLSCGSAFAQPGAFFKDVIQLGVNLKSLLSKDSQRNAKGKRIKYLMNEYEKLTDITYKFKKSRTAKQQQLSEAHNFLAEIKSSKGKFNEELAKRFLEKFGAIGIIIGSIDINEFGMTLNDIVGGLCDVIIGSSSRSEAIQDEASEGLCAETKKTIGSIIKIMESTSDNGKTLSQILVELAQLKLEESSAARLSITLESNLNSDLEVKLNQMLLIAVIQAQKRKLIEEACNMITYLNFGEEQDFCINMRNNPENGDLTLLISYIHQDECFNPINRDVLIPVNNTQSLDLVPGVVDSEELFGRTDDKTWKTSGDISFDIPGQEWMVENGWIQKGDQGPFYLKQFEIFYPPQHPDGKTRYLVESKIELVKNKLNGKTYTFDQPMVYNLKYYDNYDHQLPCNGEIHAPYRDCPNDQSYSVCISQKGNLPGPYYPTTNSTWRISMRSKYELPRIFSSTPFFLNAKIQICSRPKQVNHEWMSYGSSAGFIFQKNCCPAGHYYDVKERVKAAGQSPCKPCPSGIPRMGGYFCEMCPPGMEQGTDVYGCLPTVIANQSSTTNAPANQSSTTNAPANQTIKSENPIDPTPQSLANRNTAISNRFDPFIMVFLLFVVYLLKMVY
ncbi:uncharacterized protein [Clytia hemisphaerica]|uniref:uncharacterized protein n=1 Tax=Clytia hemisphaerica TaxID=252671 RepID=UPI0034D3DAFB